MVWERCFSVSSWDTNNFMWGEVTRLVPSVVILSFRKEEVTVTFQMTSADLKAIEGY